MLHADSALGEKVREWVAYHHRHAAPSTYIYDLAWDITVELEGPFCIDIDSNVLLDSTSRAAAVPLGYNNPKLMGCMIEFSLVNPTKTAGQGFYISNGSVPSEE